MPAPRKSPSLLRAEALLRSDPSLVDRVLCLAEPSGPATIGNPADVLALVRPLLDGSPVERVVVIAVARSNRVIETRCLSVGTDGAAIFDPRVLLRFALTAGARPAYGIVVAHNHPSGEARPSPQDDTATAALGRACDAVGVKLLDHVIVAGDLHYSYALQGRL